MNQYSTQLNSSFTLADLEIIFTPASGLLNMAIGRDDAFSLYDGFIPQALLEFLPAILPVEKNDVKGTFVTLPGQVNVSMYIAMGMKLI